MPARSASPPTSPLVGQHLNLIPSLPPSLPPHTQLSTPNSIDSLTLHKEKYTDDDLPYFATAAPALGLLLLALGRRLEIWRLSDLSSLCVLLDLDKEGGREGGREGGKEEVSFVAAFSGDGKHLAVAGGGEGGEGGREGGVRVYKLNLSRAGTEEVRVEEAKLVSHRRGKKGGREGGTVRELGWHPNGYHLVGAEEGREGGVWRVWALTPQFGLEEESVLSPEEEEGEGAREGGREGGRYVSACRCAGFTAEGTRLVTVHFQRRGPVRAGGEREGGSVLTLQQQKQQLAEEERKVDKRPWMTVWGVEEGEDRRLQLKRGAALPLGSAPVMCLGLVMKEEGWREGGRNGGGEMLGVCGDAEGRTISLGVVKEGGREGGREGCPLALDVQRDMHNFGVTAISIRHPLLASSPPSLPPYLVASTSADKTLRLQFLSAPQQSWFSFFFSHLRGSRETFLCLLALLLLLERYWPFGSPLGYDLCPSSSSSSSSSSLPPSSCIGYLVGWLCWCVGVWNYLLFIMMGCKSEKCLAAGNAVSKWMEGMLEPGH